MEQDLNNLLETLDKKENQVDIKRIFFLILSHWKLILLSVAIMFLIAYIFNRYSENIYENEISLLIQDEKNSGFDIQSAMGFGSSGTAQNLQNQIGILNSRTLVERTVKELNFKISYFVEGRVKDTEVYKDCPFVVTFDSNFIQPAGNFKFFVSDITDEDFLLEFEAENIKLYDYFLYENIEKTVAKSSVNKRFKYGEIISDEAFNFIIVKNPNLKTDFKKINNDNKYYFHFNTLQDMVKRFSSYTIEPINRDASIVKIKIRHTNVNKASDFLNALSQIYIQQGLERKNLISVNTIDFIDSQLSEISDSLSLNESRLQSFRSRNMIMNLDNQSQKAFDYIINLEQQKGELLVKNKIYQNLKKYIVNNPVGRENVFVPPISGIDDPLLNQQLLQLTELYSKRAERMVNDNPSNPLLVEINNKIEIVKKTINETINNIIITSDITIKDIDERIKSQSKIFSNLPTTERQLLGIERKYKLNDAIYTFLLEKRSEAAISKASNTPDNEIIDLSLPTYHTKISPKKEMNYSIALLLGLLLPIGFIFIKDFLNDKVLSKKDIEKITNFPIVGSILNNHYDTNIPVVKMPKSAISETFRSLRTNLRYVTKGKQNPIFLVTSLTVGEGKTFTSINLASIYAQSNKKTLLMGYDLRKPKIYQNFNLTNSKGITSYLMGENTVEEIIQKTNSPYLDIISAGPIPPNPAELIGTTENTELLKHLQNIYDYIIIDTPPIGIVTDALILFPYVDARIFVVRQNYTSKHMLENVISDYKKNNNESAVIVLNNIDPKSESSGYGYNYGYGYGHTYGYGYYSDEVRPDKKANWFKKLFSK